MSNDDFFGLIAATITVAVVCTAIIVLVLDARLDAIELVLKELHP